MPYEYKIDPDRELITFAFDGFLDDRQCRELTEKLYSDPAYRPGMRELIDGRRITRIGVTAEGVRGLLKGARTDSSRIAVVASSDAVYGLGRMTSALLGPRHGSLRVFRNIDEARRWLEAGPAPGNGPEAGPPASD